MRSYEMKITSAKYTEQGSIVATVDGIEITVPDDMGNRHRAALEEWGGVIEPYDPPVVDLNALKIALKAHVDAAAELERQKYITPGAGQAMTYQAKAAEALRYAETEGAGDYPFLTQEVGITGATLAEVAVVVDSMHSQWLAIGGLIEKARLSTKAAIDLAETEDAARSAFSGLNFEEF